MESTSRTYIGPSTDEKAFNCPHCGALAKQFWHDLFVVQTDDDRTPTALTPAAAKDFASAIEDEQQRKRFMDWVERLSTKLPFLEDEKLHRYGLAVNNLFLAKCYNCSDISIWIGDRIAYPQATAIPAPNPDMPDEAKRDYREAATVVEQSPRGAAALLRLALQRIAIALGGSGNNLNDDIAGLVRKGLDPRVQKALDVVRVVGNNAVHPGELDIRDDTATAHKLFELINLVSDIMISQPKHIEALYIELPEGARSAVERRDKVNATE